MSGLTRSHCEREVFDAAVDLILREDLPKLARLGSRVFKESDAARCLERIRKLVNRRESATAQQAMRHLAQLEASEEASEMHGEMICTEKRLLHWLAELEKAAPDPAAPEPEKPPEVTRFELLRSHEKAGRTGRGAGAQAMGFERRLRHCALRAV